ncbi:hypothetical protein BHE74_00027302 [Ensete ventricosum]|nr:hypothetical protein BHE74_00027302 [Ensete ventricosum]
MWPAKLGPRCELCHRGSKTMDVHSRELNEADSKLAFLRKRVTVSSCLQSRLESLSALVQTDGRTHAGFGARRRCAVTHCFDCNLPWRLLVVLDRHSHWTRLRLAEGDDGWGGDDDDDTVSVTPSSLLSP